MQPHANARGRGLRKLAPGLCVTIAALGLAAASPALASSGGTSYEAPAIDAPPAQGIKLTRHVRKGTAVKVKGRLRLRRRTVSLQRRVGRRWETVDRVRTGRRGGFNASWMPGRAGSYRLRLRYKRSSASAASVAEGLPRVYVYRRTRATWYGPTLFGNGVACGGKLTHETIGVANKTLPCGTKIRFRFRGRSAVAKVIDRGPFRAGYSWDLTEALAEKLRFKGVGAGPIWSTR